MGAGRDRGTGRGVRADTHVWPWMHADRLLIAQAQVLRIPLVTVDKRLEAHDDEIVPG